ncbi:hypothetical protein Tco_1047083 [Tanacetum coccineum]
MTGLVDSGPSQQISDRDWLGRLRASTTNIGSRLAGNSGTAQQQNQRDCFTNDTSRGRSLVSSAVYYEVAPQVVFHCVVVIFGGVTKYVDEILKKFNYTDVKSASTPVDLEKPLVKNGDVEIFQVTPKTSHLLAIKRIFRYLKGKPTLGLWYSRDSPFELVAYTDSDYAGATQDRKSTTGGCQFLGNRLISWQCKKQTVVATSTTEAEYVAAASCCGQVLWIQNQLLDYGYNFMNTVINIDNNSTICIIENPVQHSKTKHIEIRHHFIRDCNAKKLIQMVKIHTDHNVADLLTKGFDAGRHVKSDRDTKIPQSSGPPVKVGDEAVHKELGDKMERASTTASSLEVEQDSSNINRTQSMATLNAPSP